MIGESFLKEEVTIERPLESLPGFHAAGVMETRTMIT
jgi:hypothetical protein